MDRGIERELNMIKVDCYSCSWNGSYKDYQVYFFKINLRIISKYIRIVLLLETFTRTTCRF